MILGMALPTNVPDTGMGGKSLGVPEDATTFSK